jgi:hypothetical protein
VVIVRASLRDRRFRRLCDPGQHRHCHQRIAAGGFHVLDELRGAAIGAVAEAFGGIVFEVVVVGGVVGLELPVVS